MPSSIEGAPSDHGKEPEEMSDAELEFSKEKPEQPYVNAADPNLRTWLRAMDEKDSALMYKVAPEELMADPRLVEIIRYGHIQKLRQNPNIPIADRDTIREKKTQSFVDAQDLCAGLDVSIPSFEIIENVFKGLSYASGKPVPIPPEWDSPEKVAAMKKLGKKGEKMWEDIKHDFIRGKIRELEKGGNYEYYLYGTEWKPGGVSRPGGYEGLNKKQKAMRALGLPNMIDAIGGKSADEVAMSRGRVWMMPDYMDRLDRGLVSQFKGKDVDELKVLLEHLLRRFYLHLKGERKMTDANLNAVQWIWSGAKEANIFRNKESVDPKYHKIFEEAEEIFRPIGERGELPPKKFWNWYEEAENGEDSPEDERGTSGGGTSS